MISDSGNSTVAFSASGVERGLAEALGDLSLEDLAYPALDLLAELGNGVELGGLGGEVVVELGQLLLAHLAHPDLELGGLARHLLAGVVVGEVHGRLTLIARGGPLERLLQLRQHPARAELQQVVLGLAALERLAVDLA